MNESMNRKGILGLIVIVIVSLASIGVLLSTVLLAPPPEEQTATLVVEPSGSQSPFAQFMMGEKGSIYSLQVYQWDGASYIFRGAVGGSGGSITLVAEQPVHFDLVTYIDYYIGGTGTCASALTRTRAYIAIAGQVTTTAMDQSPTCPSSVPDIVYYVLFTYDWDVAGKPAAGATYTVTFTYDAYY